MRPAMRGPTSPNTLPAAGGEVWAALSAIVARSIESPVAATSADAFQLEDLRPTRPRRGGPRGRVVLVVHAEGRVRLLRMSGASPSRMASRKLSTRTTCAPSRSTR
jgi:hypothetical protein